MTNPESETTNQHTFTQEEVETLFGEDFGSTFSLKWLQEREQFHNKATKELIRKIPMKTVAMQAVFNEYIKTCHADEDFKSWYIRIPMESFNSRTRKFSFEKLFLFKLFMDSEFTFYVDDCNERYSRFVFEQLHSGKTLAQYISILKAKTKSVQRIDDKRFEVDGKVVNLGDDEERSIIKKRRMPKDHSDAETEISVISDESEVQPKPKNRKSIEQVSPMNMPNKDQIEGNDVALPASEPSPADFSEVDLTDTRKGKHRCKHPEEFFEKKSAQKRQKLLVDEGKPFLEIDLQITEKRNSKDQKHLKLKVKELELALEQTNRNMAVLQKNQQKIVDWIKRQ